ncbi:MAG: ATP-binding protein [Bacteroidales bacterium]|nr:ATP-binding protein [Bacteroidales bacterium]
MNNNKVSIATKPLVYSAFRYIENKVWNALAEYVDNAVQSFKDHIDVLKDINPNNKLRVEINIDVEQDIITITDNAFGITNENYDRAFELANIPLDRKGLNEFGMGMKVSSIWLSDLWSVQTKAYGEYEVKTLVFDIHEVTQKQELELPVAVEPGDPNEHYTIVTLTKLSQNKPRTRQIAYVKKHLASIYSKYIRDNILDLIVNDELLKDTKLQCLTAPYYKTPDGEKKTWRIEINFEAPKYDETGKQIGLYYAKGFIGILEKMSTSTDNGILLFRRGRVIGSSYDEKYRPKVLSGEEGSPRYKRIFGELELEGFDVSFTKSSFQDDDEFNTFIDVLRDDIVRDKSFDLFGQAQNYTKPKTQADKKKTAQQLVKTIADEISKPIVLPGDTIDPEIEIPEVVVQNNTYSSTSHEDVQTPPNDVLEISAIETEIKPNASSTYKLVISGISENSNKGLYSLTYNSTDGKYYATINLTNSFFERFRECLSTEDNILQLAYFIKNLVITELLLLESGTCAATSFRNKFNQLFGLI